MNNQKGFANIILIVVIIILVGVFVYFVFFQKPGPVSTTTTSPISDGQNDILVKKKNAIEAEYPEFKNFENNLDLGGQRIKIEGDNDDHYFAYMVLGSGVRPILEATCFRVDKTFRVSKVGEFPSTDPYTGYMDINVKNCSRIK